MLWHKLINRSVLTTWLLPPASPPLVLLKVLPVTSTQVLRLCVSGVDRHKAWRHLHVRCRLTPVHQ